MRQALRYGPLALAVSASIALAQDGASPEAEVAAADPPMTVYRADPEAPGQVLEHFTGPAVLNGEFALHGSDRLGHVAVATYQPGGRTRWHSHPLGQLLIVTDGTGWVQAEGQPVTLVQPGDIIWTAPNVPHWHGATRTTRMTHLAISERVPENTTVWMDAVSEEQFDGPMP